MDRYREVSPIRRWKAVLKASRRGLVGVDTRCNAHDNACMRTGEEVLYDWYHDGIQLRYLHLLQRRQRQRPVPFYSLIAVWAGDLHLHCYKYDLDLRPGEAALLPPGLPITTTRTADTVDPADAILCGFMPAGDRLAADPLARLPLPIRGAMDDQQHWRHQVHQLLEHWPRRGKLALQERLLLRPVLDDLLTRLLLRCAQEGQLSVGATRPVPEWLQAAMQLLRHEAIHSDFTLRALAAKLGVSLSSLQHAFRHHYGETPGAVLRHQRLQLATERLRSNPERSLAEVAHSCGFVSPGALGACFRRRFGISPSRFRAGDAVTR